MIHSMKHQEQRLTNTLIIRTVPVMRKISLKLKNPTGPNCNIQLLTILLISLKFKKLTSFLLSEGTKEQGFFLQGEKPKVFKVCCQHEKEREIWQQILNHSLTERKSRMVFPALKNNCYLNIIYLKMEQTGLKLIPIMLTEGEVREQKWISQLIYKCH